METNSDKQPDSPHPLSEIPGVPPAFVQALKAHWIETAEQVLALFGTKEGRAGLQALLVCHVDELETLLSTLSDVVGPEEAARLLQPTPGLALGLVLSDEQKKQVGLK
jgi:hypothetical protein